MDLPAFILRYDNTNFPCCEQRLSNKQKDHNVQPTKQYATITQPNPRSKKRAIEQTGYKCVLCETVYADQIRICTDHSTSISGISPCLTIKDKIREASVNLEDKKDPQVSLLIQMLSSDAFRCYDSHKKALCGLV